MFIVLVLWLLGRSYPGSGADLLDWKPTRDFQTELELEQDDISQMIAAQNRYRRKRGARELTEADASRMAKEDNRLRSRTVPMEERSIREMERRMRADGEGAESPEPGSARSEERDQPERDG